MNKVSCAQKWKNEANKTSTTKYLSNIGSNRKFSVAFFFNCFFFLFHLIFFHLFSRYSHGIAWVSLCWALRNFMTSMIRKNKFKSTMKILFKTSSWHSNVKHLSCWASASVTRLIADAHTFFVQKLSLFSITQTEEQRRNPNKIYDFAGRVSNNDWSSLIDSQTLHFAI